jgi:hypothetical protein
VQPAGAHALHVDLDAGVLLLEDIERLAHLQRLGIVEAERDRGIRDRNADKHEPSENSNRKPTNDETRDHSTLSPKRPSYPSSPIGFAARAGPFPKCVGSTLPSDELLTPTAFGERGYMVAMAKKSDRANLERTIPNPPKD